MNTAALRPNVELGDWIRSFALPVGGWKCFHTAGFIPKSKLDWAWKPEAVEIPGNAPADEFDTMARYRRFMHERDRRKISWVAAVERNPDWSGVNKGFHVHAMWTAECDIYRTDSWRRWANQWGVNKLKQIEGNDRAVANYCGKYCVDESCLVEWEVNGSLWHTLRKLGEVCPAWRVV